MRNGQPAVDSSARALTTRERQVVAKVALGHRASSQAGAESRGGDGRCLGPPEVGRSRLSPFCRPGPERLLRRQR